MCPVYPAGEKIDKKYDPINFSKLISQQSKVQVIMAKDEKYLKNFFNKNLIHDEIVVCMGAGSISKWILRNGFKIKK